MTEAVNGEGGDDRRDVRRALAVFTRGAEPGNDVTVVVGEGGEDDRSMRQIQCIYFHRG